MVVQRRMEQVEFRQSKKLSKKQTLESQAWSTNDLAMAKYQYNAKIVSAPGVCDCPEPGVPISLRCGESI